MNISPDSHTRDRYSRTRLLYGDSAMNRFRTAKVAVMGLGGVGSYCVEFLARSGIGHFLLVDFDRVKLSNINRQIHALDSTINQYKAEALRARVNDIDPTTEVEVFCDFCAIESREQLLAGVDFVIDAIDSLGPKTGLIADLVRLGIPFVSILGAGGKTDPSQIRLTDITEARVCPLAKRVKRYLKRRGILSGVPVIWSGESPLAQFAPGLGSEDEWEVDRGRKRGTLSSVAHIPAIMGGWAAGYCLDVLRGSTGSTIRVSPGADSLRR